MKALILDDSRTMRRLLASYVQEFSIDVVEAGDGIEALDQLQRNPSTDIALVDWDMPRMNGLEFVKAVRADQAFASMKVMMVTSHNEMADIGHALEEGANDFLMKPFTGEMVSDKLRMLGLVE